MGGGEIIITFFGMRVEWGGGGGGRCDTALRGILVFKLYRNVA